MFQGIQRRSSKFTILGPKCTQHKTVPEFLSSSAAANREEEDKSQCRKQK